MVPPRTKRPTRPTRGLSLETALRALVLLRTGHTIADLSKELGVGWRTTYRLIHAIKRAGIPVATSRVEGCHGVFYVVHPSSLRAVFGL